MKLSGVGICAQNFQDFPPTDDNLLLFRAREIAVDCLRYAGSLLQCQPVEMHSDSKLRNEPPIQVAIFTPCGPSLAESGCGQPLASWIVDSNF